MRISLILPYWKRQAAAVAALVRLADLYPHLDLEVIVVDDGDPEPFRVPLLPLNLVCLRLPQKDRPMSPVTAWNRGAEIATGEAIAISCVEVLHEQPVLAGMLEELELRGPMAYVMAAAWCPESRAWHCHSTVHFPECPPGTGAPFCALLHKSLYRLVGGFDEIYRDGVGYEDRDFIHRLNRAGAEFVVRDDLVVQHPKTGATIKWGAEAFARNEAIYRQRWLC